MEMMEMGLSKLRETKTVKDATIPMRKNHRTALGRSVVFLLAASSIACLLADFYHLCPMQLFAPFIFLPAVVLLLLYAAFDHFYGDQQL